MRLIRTPLMPQYWKMLRLLGFGFLTCHVLTMASIAFEGSPGRTANLLLIVK